MTAFESMSSETVCRLVCVGMRRQVQQQVREQMQVRIQDRVYQQTDRQVGTLVWNQLSESLGIRVFCQTEKI
jgi:hypothetical protein